MTRVRHLVVWVMCLLPLCVASAQTGTPADTVGQFLTAWGQSDSAAMYRLLASQSQAAYPEQLFVNRYTVANEALALTGVRHTLGDTRFQGVTAAVTYDVVIESSLFGQIEDSGRTMRLVNEGGRWGIAWSSMDIFPQLPSVGQITSSGVLPPRANIYDRNGNPVANTGTVVTMYTARPNMTNEAACLSLLAQLTRRPLAAYERLLTNYPPGFDTIFNIGEMNLDTFEANRAALTGTCGISITSERQTRAYYGNNAMGHVAGYTGQMSPEQVAEFTRLGYSSDARIGQAGVERVYERQLAGTAERVLRIIDSGGTVLREFATQSGSAPAPVQMTIDRDLQLAFAQAMFDAYQYAAPDWGGVAAEGAGVIIDVKTGAILAMVSYPFVDPQLFDPTSPEPLRRVELLRQVTSDERRPLTNHAIQSRYTPGSVYKLVTAAAVLNEGITQPGEVFDCQLYWSGTALGDEIQQRPDWRVADGFPAAGPVTPAEAVSTSCNPFFWETGAVLFNRSGNLLADYARRLGMGEPYTIYPGLAEAAADLDNPASVARAINNSVGQGDVTVPPIQIAVMTATLANGGTAYRPYIVQQVGGFDGAPLVERFEPEILNEIDFAPGVLEEIQRGMCGTTTNEDLGTAYIRFNNAPYSSCGKTGTAQTARYPNAWYTAYAPADDPQIAITVVVSQSLEGSQVAAPIVRRVLDYYFNAQRIEPYPDWWAIAPYEPLNIPEGSTGG
ncbi:MAG: penicillin-binding transpeptidase domain-containing protein [Anaerolineae bacterium]|nr:penicillin-binding transpeptidase domain-containing protein [Anaerolineae bacterium]